MVKVCSVVTAMLLKSNNPEDRTMKARFFIIPIILLAACQPVEVFVPVDKPEETAPSNGKWTMTVNATLNTDTKALELTNNGGSLDAYWVGGEKVSVYLGGDHKGYLTAAVSETNNIIATLAGELTSVEGISTDTQLTLLFPGRDDKKWEYTGQDGAAPDAASTISRTFSYGLATVTVKGMENSTITCTGATFDNQQSIYRFGFIKSDDTTPGLFDPQQFTVSTSVESGHLVRTVSYAEGQWNSSAWGSLTVNPTATGDHFYYMAIRNDNTSADETYHFTAIDNNSALRIGSKVVGSSHLGQGKFISMKSIAMPLADFGPAEGTISSSTAVL